VETSRCSYDTQASLLHEALWAGNPEVLLTLPITLTLTVWAGNPEVLRAILEINPVHGWGAIMDVDAPSSSRRTPLQMATYLSSEDASEDDIWAQCGKILGLGLGLG